jgi:hypothetical protein
MRRTRAAHLDKAMALCIIKMENIAVARIFSCRIARRISQCMAALGFRDSVSNARTHILDFNISVANAYTHTWARIIYVSSIYVH